MEIKVTLDTYYDYQEKEKAKRDMYIKDNNTKIIKIILKKKTNKRFVGCTEASVQSYFKELFRIIYLKKTQGCHNSFVTLISIHLQVNNFAFFL